MPQSANCVCAGKGEVFQGIGVQLEFWRCRIRKACEVGMMQAGKRKAQDVVLV